MNPMKWDAMTKFQVFFFGLTGTGIFWLLFGDRIMNGPPVFRKADMQCCLSSCVDAEVSRYMAKIYGTQDQYFQEARRLCEFRLAGQDCWESQYADCHPRKEPPECAGCKVIE